MYSNYESHRQSQPNVYEELKGTWTPDEVVKIPNVSCIPEYN